MRAGDRFIGHSGAVYALAQDRTPGRFLSGSGDGNVVRWDVTSPPNGELLVRTDQAVFSLCLLPGTNWLIIGGEHGDLRVADLADRRELQLLRSHRRGIFRIIALPDHRIACAGGDGILSVWSVASRELRGTAPRTPALTLLRSIPLVDEKLRDLALSSDGQLLAIASGDGTVRVLDTEGFNEKHTVIAHEGGATCVAWHPGKAALLSGGKDGHVRFWRTDEAYRALRSIAAHRSTIYRIAFDPSGGLCATASRDKSAKLWAADTFDPLARMDREHGGHALSVNDVLWMDDALITAGDDRSVIRWTSGERPSVG